jgi:predicted PurR-regulated permease PerM
MAEEKESFVNIQTKVSVTDPRFSALLNKIGVQTTPPLARGYLKGSAIEATNADLTSVCDFKFIFDFSFNLGDLIFPAAALAQAIKNAKLAAAAKIRSFLKQFTDKLRAVYQAIVAALNLDPTGRFSVSFSIAKQIINKINAAIKQLAQFIEDILVWVFVAQQIKQLIDWILSLPQQIKQLLQRCLASFTNSIKQVADSIQSIPSQIVNETTSQIRTIANDLASTSEQSLKSLENELKNSEDTLPPVVIDALNDPTDASANNLLIYIESATPNSNSILANTTSTPSPKNTP